jgi:hypothetical protein
MLSTFCHENQNDWDDYLPYLLMGYRSSEHASTKCSPNLLMFGQEINMPIDIMFGPTPDTKNFECTIQYVEWLKNASNTAYEVAAQNLLGSAKRQKKTYDSKLKIREYQDGDFVWRWYPPTANTKLGLGWTGPFKVILRKSNLVYGIQKVPNAKILFVHIDHLKPYCGDKTPEGWESDPDYDINSGEDTSFELLDESNTVEPLEKSPVITRTGRVIKPRKIYSP